MKDYFVSEAPENKFVPMSTDNAERVRRALPQNVSGFLREDPRAVVAGGFVRDTISNRPVSDVDVYLWGCSPEDVREAALTFAGRYDYTVERESRNALTLVKDDTLTVQFVFNRAYTSVVDIIQSFDFLCCQAAVGGEGPGVVSELFFYDAENGALRWSAPASSLAPKAARGAIIRTIKLCSRGWKMTPSEQIRLQAAFAAECERLNISPTEHLKSYYADSYDTQPET